MRTGLGIAAVALSLAGVPATPRASTPSAASTSHRSATGGVVEERRTIPLFGAVSVYLPEPIQNARGVVLFVSGDGGWNKGVVDMARRSAPHALVVGLSMPAWQKTVEKAPGACWYPAGELEAAAQAIEKLYGFPRYIAPILAGYSSGATVVYGAIAQAPPESFQGAVSLGFCPDLEVKRPFCSKGAWKPEWNAAKKLSLLPVRADLPPRSGGESRWIALQGEVDQVCDPEAVGTFASQIPAAKVVSLEKVGHGFSVTPRWGAAYDAAIASFLEPAGAWEPPPRPARAPHEQPESPAAAAVLDAVPAGREGKPSPTAAAQSPGAPGALPPAGQGIPGAAANSPAAAVEDPSDKLDGLDLPLETEWPEGARSALIFVSGDGGWAELDREVAGALVRRGIAVIGWNTLRYFWTEKTPERFRSDLARVVAAIPGGAAVIAGGYSFGAEVVPVTLAAEPHAATSADDPLARIEGLVLIGPGPYATFEVSPLDWIRTSTAPTPHPVPSALAATGRPTLCLDAAEVKDSGCPAANAGLVERVSFPGGHHFNGDYEGLAKRIAEFIASVPRRTAEREAQRPVLEAR